MTVRSIPLRNGVEVLVQKMDTRTACCMIRVKAGAWDTNDSNEGVAHFLEHMMFKSTNGMNSVELNKQFQALGCDVNAWTWYADTCYHITGVAGDRFYEAVRLLCDMVSDPSWSKKDLDSERSVILEERNMYSDNTRAILEEKLTKDTFSGHRFARTELGSAEQINAITTRKLRKFYKDFYVGNNTTVTVTGGVDPETIGAIIEDSLALNSGDENKASETALLFIPGRRFDYDNDCEQAHVSFDLHFERPMVPTLMAIKLGMNAIGDGMGSRLFEQVREKRGLAYGVWGSCTTQRRFCTISCSAGVSHDKVDEAVTAIQETVVDAFDNGITEEELDRAKIDYLRGFVFNSESSRGTANRISQEYATYGFTTSVEEMEELINSITLDQVNEALKALPRNFVTGTIRRAA